jgi:Flp pilus assembly pilin Flp
MGRYFVTFVRDEAGATTSFDYAVIYSLLAVLLVAVLSALRSGGFWGF